MISSVMSAVRRQESDTLARAQVGNPAAYACGRRALAVESFLLSLRDLIGLRLPFIVHDCANATATKEVQ